MSTIQDKIKALEDAPPHLHALLAARVYLSDPKNWVKWVEGMPPPCHGHCALTALCTSTIPGIATSIASDALYRALSKSLWRQRAISIPAFNDHPDTTHADVLALFDRAIAAESTP